MEYALGVLVSLVVDAIKEYFGTNTLGTYFVLGIVSLVLGGVYVLFAGTVYWQTFTQVVISASAFHNLVLRRLEEHE